jgi:dihydroxyacid dehydratase/phosphogluconate dehydratase
MMDSPHAPDIRPKDILTFEAFENAIASHI